MEILRDVSCLPERLQGVHVIPEPQESPLFFGTSNKLVSQGIPIRNPDEAECPAESPSLLSAPLRIGMDRPLPFLVQDPGLLPRPPGLLEGWEDMNAEPPKSLSRGPD